MSLGVAAFVVGGQEDGQSASGTANDCMFSVARRRTSNGEERHTRCGVRPAGPYSGGCQMRSLPSSQLVRTAKSQGLQQTCRTMPPPAEDVGGHASGSIGARDRLPEPIHCGGKCEDENGRAQGFGREYGVDK